MGTSYPTWGLDAQLGEQLVHGMSPGMVSCAFNCILTLMKMTNNESVLPTSHGRTLRSSKQNQRPPCGACNPVPAVAPMLAVVPMPAVAPRLPNGPMPAVVWLSHVAAFVAVSAVSDTAVVGCARSRI